MSEVPLKYYRYTVIPLSFLFRMSHIITQRMLDLLAELTSRTSSSYDELNPFCPEVLFDSYGGLLFGHG